MRRVGGETFIFLFLLFFFNLIFTLGKALLQEFSRTCEGGDRNAEVRSIRCRMGVHMGSSAARSATEPQAEWPDGSWLSLPESNLTQAQPAAWMPKPHWRGPPSQQMVGGGRTEDTFGQAIIALCTAMARGLGSYCPFPGALAFAFQVGNCPPCQ